MFIVKDEQEKKQADIRIVGVGGGGNNALETMIKEGVQGVQFIAINTDNQALEASSAKKKLQIGSKITKGLGAGANPEVGRRAAVESYEEIVKVLKGADMVFVTAGMGGGTGTGATPFVAQAAKELDLLTVGIVTKPFVFEGYKRMAQAKKGISELTQHVDTLIVVPNEQLLSLSEKDTPLIEAFKLTDDVLLQAVKGIAELVSVPGLINLDFADIKTVMKDKGMALMGRGVAKGPDRAEKAIQSAVSSPLLSGVLIKGATGMIVNLTSDSSLSLRELNGASSILTQMADPSADVIVGTVIDEKMNGELSVTVIATGFEDQENTSDNKALMTQAIEQKEPEQKNLLKELAEQEKPDWSAKPDRDSFQEEPTPEPVNQGDLNLAEPKSTVQELATQDLTKDPQTDSLLEDHKNKDQQAKDSTKTPSHLADQQPLAPPESEDPSHQKSTDFNLKDQQVSNTEDTESKTFNQQNIAPPNLSESFNHSISTKKEEETTSVKDSLLSKARAYQESLKNKKSQTQDRQISMEWPNKQEELSSPFEADLDLSEEDMS